MTCSKPALRPFRNSDLLWFIQMNKQDNKQAALKGLGVELSSFVTYVPYEVLLLQDDCLTRPNYIPQRSE